MIFVDSSFWIATRLPQDAHHDTALDLLERHGDDDLLTSNHVRGETWTFLRRRAGHREAVAFLDMLERSPRTDVDRIDGVLEEEALRWLRRHDERTYSFVDATSFALMRAQKIRRALAFDGDFAAAGFQELRAD